MCDWSSRLASGPRRFRQMLRPTGWREPLPDLTSPAKPGTEPAHQVAGSTGVNGLAAGCGNRRLATHHVLVHKLLDHVVHLDWRFQHVEVTTAYSPTIDDLGKPFGHHVGCIQGRGSGDMQCGDGDLLRHRNT